MKELIVTGTLGFIGKNLMEELKKDNIVYQINEDIFDETNWVSFLKTKLEQINPDGIFHVGACSNTLENDVNYMMTRNYEFTKILSDYCFDKQIPLIYSSSAANYGTNNLYPSNLYGWSKYVAEDYVLQNGGVALRYFNVYGPGEEHKGKMSSVAYQMYVKHKNNEEIKLFPLNPKRDFVYVKDVVNANITAFNNYEESGYDYYEVGSGEARTFEDVLNLMEIPFTYTSEDEIPVGYQFRTESNKKKWLKGWSPLFKLEDGLKDYKDYLNGQI